MTTRAEVYKALIAKDKITDDELAHLTEQEKIETMSEDVIKCHLHSRGIAYPPTEGIEQLRARLQEADDRDGPAHPKPAFILMPAQKKKPWKLVDGLLSNQIQPRIEEAVAGEDGEVAGEILFCDDVLAKFGGNPAGTKIGDTFTTYKLFFNPLGSQTGAALNERASRWLQRPDIYGPCVLEITTSLKRFRSKQTPDLPGQVIEWKNWSPEAVREALEKPEWNAQRANFLEMSYNDNNSPYPPPTDQDRGMIGKLAVAGAMAYGAHQVSQHYQNQNQSQQPQQQQYQQGYQQQSGGYPQQQQQQPQQSGGGGYGQAAMYGLGGAALGAAAYGAYNHHQSQTQVHGMSAATDYNIILQILQRTVTDQNIGAFYPQGSLEHIAQRICSSGAVTRLTSAWNLPLEPAMESVKLALFDTWFYLDDSASMGKSRQEELKRVLSRVAFAASLYDSDGVNVRWMNSKVEGNGLTSEEAAMSMLRKVSFDGRTPLGTELERKILNPAVVKPAQAGSLRKPVLIVAITDGEPTGESRHKLVDVIKHAKSQLERTRYGADAVSFQLAQVGNDKEARAFLEEIDSNYEIGKLVDVTSNFENEAVTLTNDLWIMKLLLGGISSAYDATDEGGTSGFAGKVNYAVQNPSSYRHIGFIAPNSAPNYGGGPPGPQGYGSYGAQGGAPQGARDANYQQPGPAGAPPQGGSAGGYYGGGPPPAQQNYSGAPSQQQAPYPPYNNSQPPYNQQGYNSAPPQGNAPPNNVFGGGGFAPQPQQPYGGQYGQQSGYNGGGEPPAGFAFPQPNYGQGPPPPGNY
ncbi:hypothetical protein MNV49_002469 [Pseudohyphozyma bogoriensis]|nr:hypothetical protein MNV49_002469 [Pseudohyphozyma bogoriensis]